MKKQSRVLFWILWCSIFLCMIIVIVLLLSGCGPVNKEYVTKRTAEVSGTVPEGCVIGDGQPCARITIPRYLLMFKICDQNGKCQMVEEEVPVEVYNEYHP